MTAIAAPIEVEEESVAIARLINRISGSLCLSYGPEVQKYIDKYVKQGRHSTSCLLARASYYNPIFEEALLYYGLPLELKHLPVIRIESESESLFPARCCWVMAAYACNGTTI